MLPWKQALICAKKNMNTLCFLFSHLHLNIKCKNHNYREGCSSLREHRMHSLVREKIKVPFSTINEPLLCFLEFFMDNLTNISLSVYGVISFSKTKPFFFSQSTLWDLYFLKVFKHCVLWKITLKISFEPLKGKILTKDPLTF